MKAIHGPEKAGTPCARHHRAPRAQRCPRAASSRPAMATRATEHRITSSPACQAKSSLLVISTRVSWPVSASTLFDRAERMLEWKGASVTGPADGVGRDVVMPASSCFSAIRG